MTYEYYCNNCQKAQVIIKELKEVGNKEYCPICKSELVRVFTSSTIKTSDGTKFSKDK